MEVYQYKTAIKFETPAQLPVWKGSALRGGFGSALRKACCPDIRLPCTRCNYRSICTYAVVFEGPLPKNAEVLTANNYIEKPLILEYPGTTQEFFKAGDILEFNFILAGSAVSHFAKITTAIDSLGKDGIGTGRESGLGKYSLESITSANTLSGESKQVFSRETDQISLKNHIPAQYSDAEALAKKIGRQGGLKLVFTTPTQIVHEGQMQEVPPFHALIRRLQSRISNLSQFYCGKEIGWDFLDRIERASKVKTESSCATNKKVVRYSRRAGRIHTFEGCLGEVSYSGEIDTDLLTSIIFGTVTHVGKKTTFGFGKYVLTEPELNKEETCKTQP